MKNRSIQTFLFILIGISFLSGCSGKKEGLTSTKIFVGSILDTSSQTGGIIIYGNNPLTGESFGKTFPIGAMDLSNGPWEFAAISYDGNSVGQIMEGTLRCARASVTLNGGDVSVPLNLNTTNCFDQLFGTAGSKDGGGQPYPLTLYSCMNPDAVDQRDGSACNKGVAQSHRVILPEFSNGGPTGGGLVSACITHGGANNILSSIKIPFFEVGFGGIPFIVRSFDQAACAGTPKVYTFPDGYKTPSFPEYGSALSDAGVSNDVYLFANPCDTATFGGGATPFDFNDQELGAGTKLLCNPDQINTYMTANPTLNYVLGKDIDFGGVTYNGPVMASNFTGILNAIGKRLSNFTINCDGVATDCGLLKQINGGEVRGLNLSDITVSVDASSAVVGALSGKILNNGSVRNLIASNIMINATGNPNSVGGIIGTIDASGGGIDNSLISNLSLNIDEGNSFGGLIGSAGDSAFVRSTKLENIYINSVIDGSAGAGNVGGVIGNVTAATTQVELWDVNLDGLYAGDLTYPLEITSGFGGLIGNSGRVRIYKSRASGFADIEGMSATLQVGGLVGFNGDDFDIKESLSDVDIYADYGTGAGVGGIIGDSSITAASMIGKVRNLGVISCNDACGGLVGYLSSGGVAVTIDESYNSGDVSAIISDAGGLIGNGENFSVQNSVNRGDVYSDADAGGIVGVVINNGTISQSINGGDVVTDNGNAGGLIGTHTTGGTCTNSVTYGNRYDFSGDFGSNIYELVGFDAASFTSTDCFFENLSLGESLGTAATFADLTDITSTPLAGATTAFASLTGTNSASAFVNDAGGIKTAYEVSMEKLGIDYLGSRMDPLPIYTVAEWNSIGDDPLLMNKSFILENYLYFAYGTFNPIGSQTNCYSGNFLGNGYGLSQILRDESGGGQGDLGVFRKLCHNGSDGSTAKVDHYDELNNISYSFNIDDATFISDVYHVGILAGSVVDSNNDSVNKTDTVVIFGVNITNSSATTGGTGVHAGGLAGNIEFGNRYSEITNVYLSNVDITNNASGGGAGGLVGNIFGTPTITTDRVRFKMNTFDFGNVTSAGRAGGMVGFLNNGSVEVENVTVANSTITGAGAVGGIVGTSYGNNNLISTVFKYSSVTDGSSGSYLGGILGEAQMSSGPIILKQSYAFSIDLTGNGSLGGLVGGSFNSGGGSMSLESNYAIVNSATGGGTFGGIDATGTPAAAEAMDSYYYLDGTAYGTLGVALGNPGDINNSSLVPDLSLGTEYLLYGLDHPQKPFEIFPYLFID
ncbi:MAG: hypothetical protein K9K67_00375 [Bacteriovoracaceae bacterium]|nr:hypothetical protein [Bacteriovoracaceae bacterium]